MAPRKNTGKAKATPKAIPKATPKATRGRKKSKSKSPPKTPPRPRVLCPGCSTEITIHKMVSDTQAFVYASSSDMKQLGIECKNESCAVYIEGVEGADDKQPVNPLVEKCVNKAKEEHAAIKAAKKEEKKEEKAENKKRKRDEKEAEYAKYDPFSGAKEKEAEQALKRQKRQVRQKEKIIKGWKKIEKAAEKLAKLEQEGLHTEE